MAAPGIKISELTKYGYDASEEAYLSGLSSQKLFSAYNGQNYQTSLNMLSSKFIARDFSAFETAHLSGDWNYMSARTQANDPKFPIDVANGNTLSALQSIFDRLSSIWNIRVPFVNKYEPNIRVVEINTRWIPRDNGSLKNAGEQHGVSVRDAAWPTFPQVGINTIGDDGGYVFLKSENPGLAENVYMNLSDELDGEVPGDPQGRTWLEMLGWDEDERTPVTLIRFQINPTSQLGATFHCAYEAKRADGDNKGRTDHVAQVYLTYAGLNKNGQIHYFYGRSVHTPDHSPHQDNSHWGEGRPSWPDITGGPWRGNKDKHLSVVNVSGSYGPHGIFIDVYDYRVNVNVQRITIADE